MFADKKILVLPGDGVGPECVAEALKILDWLESKLNIKFNLIEGLVGGSSYDVHGVPLSNETLETAKDSNAILFGSVGGPKWDNVERVNRPENGLLKLRKELDLFANLRPANIFSALINSSPLKKEIVDGLDILIIRELTSGVYFGEPKKIDTLADGSKVAIDTQRYTSTEIERVAKVAFELSLKRSKKVCSTEKANVMETGVLWREIVSKLHNDKYKEIELSHMYADACSMELVRNPKQFDVILTDNLFGDMLSDQASMLTGSIGMLPSASLGERNISGRQYSLYEPIHGSAPDIAGKGIANPIAQILSLSMMLKYSFDLTKEQEIITKAISNCLFKGYRTRD
ncbi:MAG: 3-isopropylmalate dehydrogenase, partial [Alphaproteobacteria bacterium MarineAlpha2_Bin1]